MPPTRINRGDLYDYLAAAVPEHIDSLGKRVSDATMEDVKNVASGFKILYPKLNTDEIVKHFETDILDSAKDYPHDYDKIVGEFEELIDYAFLMEVD